ncbi:myosin-2 essential light chain [Drosophila guanche]|uniref:Blast:Myosin-2 essential light chain n=1 Tax=Drosophila guanche TaxID=7266 RepID=A0A3B0K1C6_DROGU|nr:myosin-2 essential light chain [Drosophila guanche]SPP79759.1 blast:Myosin-2 essential light chain [Drosophila guanche]
MYDQSIEAPINEATQLEPKSGSIMSASKQGPSTAPKPKNRGHLPWLRDAFKQHEHRGDGKISVEHLGDCLRVMGANPMESLVQHHIRQLQAAGLQRISFDEVLAIYTGLGKNSAVLDAKQGQEKAAEFISSLRLLDVQGTGYLPAARLRRVLNKCSECLSEEEMDELLKDRVNDQGLVNYVDLVHAIMDA